MLHSYPFYITDWRESSAALSMTLSEQGAYRNLLDICWREGSLPASERALALIAMATTEEWNSVRSAVLSQFFIDKDNRYHNRVVDSKRPKVLTLKESRVEGARKANAKRYGGHVAERPAERHLGDSLSESTGEPPSDTLSDRYARGRPPSPSTTPSESLQTPSEVLKTYPQIPKSELTPEAAAFELLPPPPPSRIPASGFPVPPAKGEPRWTPAECDAILKAIGWTGSIRTALKDHGGALEKFLDQLTGRMLPTGDDCALRWLSSRVGWFQEFWAAYWLHKGRQDAFIAYYEIVDNLNLHDRIMAAVDAQAPDYLAKEPQWRPHATTWLRGAKWEDSDESGQNPQEDSTWGPN